MLTTPSVDECKRYLVKRCWPEGVHCPRCGNLDVYPAAKASIPGTAETFSEETARLISRIVTLTIMTG